MKTIQTQNLSKLLKPYSDEWVALSQKTNKVISSGQNLSQVVNDAHEKGEEHPVVTRVPKDYGNYILGF